MIERIPASCRNEDVSPMSEQPIFSSTPLELVAEGMTVVDADGRRLGTVIRLHMGDPDAASIAGNEPAQAVLGSGWSADPEGLNDLPNDLARELERVGFLEVDAPGLSGAARFIPGDRVADVSGEVVRLHPHPRD
jgi:hypothetical protein